MRRLLLLGLLVPMLAGCTEPIVGDDDFQRTCPSWHPSPSTPQYRNTALHHDADSSNEEFRQEQQRDKWIIVPGAGEGFRYHDGVLAYVELQFNVSLIDAELVFEAYRASLSENVTGDAGPTTGPRLAFTGPDGTVMSQVRFGPHSGHENPIIGETAAYRVNLQPAPDQTNPSRVRLDAFFYGNQDDEDNTDAASPFDVRATLWYLHDDCHA